jgi:hypothetical protein
MFGARKTFKEDTNIWRRKLRPQTRTNTLKSLRLWLLLAEAV